MLHSDGKQHLGRYNHMSDPLLPAAPAKDKILWAIVPKSVSLAGELIPRPRLPAATMRHLCSEKLSIYSEAVSQVKVV